jgi:prolyl oligopeptidase PreP (S9A serine peptidase family)
MGIKAHKQNTFDDVAAVARWLQEEGYTNPEGTMLTGGSNGGLTTASTVLQYPQHFGSAVVTAPLLNLERFIAYNPNFEAWASDYGDPYDPQERVYVTQHSAMNRIERTAKNSDVSFWIKTGSMDDRVNPLHALEFAIRRILAHPQSRTLLFMDEFAHGTYGMENRMKKMVTGLLRDFYILGIKTLHS